MTKTTIPLAVTAILLAFSAVAKEKSPLELTPNLTNGKNIFEVCTACHTPEGWGYRNGIYPQLSGQHQSVLIKQLADIQALNRDAPTMYPFTLPSEIGGNQGIADVTAYIEKLPMDPENGVGEGDNLRLGKKLYRQKCIHCHGKTGAGSARREIPRVHGQHYNYLLRQFRLIKEGKRKQVNPKMLMQIKNFTQEEVEAVLDYVSRLKPPKKLLANDPNWFNPDFDW